MSPTGYSEEQPQKKREKKNSLREHIATMISVTDSQYQTFYAQSNIEPKSSRSYDAPKPLLTCSWTIICSRLCIMLNEV